jgi:hypothetical protein
MIRLHFDPIAVVLESARALWPDMDCDIHWCEPAGHAEGYGSTTWTDGEPPCILIRADIPMTAIVEVIAHELAHVAEPEDDHGAKWDAAFTAVQEEYNRRVGQLAGENAG